MKLTTYILIVLWVCAGLAIVMPLMSPIVSGNLGTFKQYECIQLKTILNSTWVNISTISLPDSTIAASQLVMVKTSGTFTYSFCNTSVIGIYIYDYYDNTGAVYVNNFEITGNGEVMNTSKALLYIVLLGVLIALAIFSISKVSSTENYGWSIAFICFTYILTIAVLFMAWQIAGNFLTSIPALNSILYLLWLLSMILFLPFILVLIMYLFSKLAGEKEIKKLVDMGYSNSEASSMVRRR